MAHIQLKSRSIIIVSVIALSPLVFLFQNMTSSRYSYSRDLGACIENRDGKQLIGSRNRKSEAPCGTFLGEQLLDFKPRGLWEGMEVTFSKAPSADFRKAQILGASFNNSDLKAAQFESVPVWDSSFVATDLTDSTFSNSQLTRVRFAGETSSYLALMNGRFDKAKALGVSFEFVDLTSAQFTAAELSSNPENGPLFSDARLVGGNFENAQLKGDLRKTDFSAANLSRASIERGTVTDLIFRNANLMNVSLNDVTVCGMLNFSEANLRSAKMTSFGLVGKDGTSCPQNTEINFKKANLQLAQLSFRERDLNSFCRTGSACKIPLKVSFEKADLRGADLSHWPKAIATNFTGALYNASTQLPFDEKEAKRLNMLRSK